MKELLEAISALEDLAKSQIVQGGNSARNQWAGSKVEEQQRIPKPNPNGTDYKTPDPVAHKALEAMTDEEIMHYVAMRKSAIPNPRAAEMEIDKLPGVTKSLCSKCFGAGINAVSKSVCDNCLGHGVMYDVSDEKTLQMVKSIQMKYNVGGELQKSPHGGASGDADTTPANPPPVKPVKTDDTGETPWERHKFTKAVEGDEAEEPQPDKPEEAEPMEEETAKSMAAIWTDSLRTIIKGLKEVYNRQDQIGEALAKLSDSHVTFAKSMMAQPQSTNPGNGSAGNPVPARGPRAASGNVQVLEKGFVDQAPGPDGATKYDMATMKKAAGIMAQQGLLDPMEVFRMDARVPPTEPVRKSIEAFIEKGGTTPQVQSRQ